MSSDLVHQKTEKLSGGNNNYWLIELTDKDNQKIVVECEDIIEHFRMTFDLATVFKSIWRLCKLKQGFGKPGSSLLYEAQKIRYYADEGLILTTRERGWFIGRIMRSVFNLLLGGNIFAPLSDTITISHPKRLNPYTFDLYDFIEAMEPTGNERQILHNTLRLAQLRKHPRVHSSRQIKHATRLKLRGKRIEERELWAATRIKSD